MKTFEEYLKQKHAETYMGTDDDMPESFEHYLDNYGVEIMNHAQHFITTLLEKQREEYVEIIEKYSEGSDVCCKRSCYDIINLIKSHDKI